MKTPKKMKTLNRKTIYLTSLLFAMLLLGCNKSDDEMPNESPLHEKVLVDFTTRLNTMAQPENLVNNTSNSSATIARAFFNSIKTSSEIFSSFFVIPQSIESRFVSNSQTYTWSDGTSSVSYTITELSDRYTLLLTVEDPTEEIDYKIEGYELKQTNFLKLKFFDDNTLKTELTWELKGEVLHVDLVELFDGDTTKMEYNTNDNSGMIKVYEGTQLTTEIVWNSDGSGTFTDHLANESFTF